MVIENTHYESWVVLFLETTRDALLPLEHNSVCQRQPEEIRIHKGESVVGLAGRPSSQTLSHMFDVPKQLE